MNMSSLHTLFFVYGEGKIPSQKTCLHSYPRKLFISSQRHMAIPKSRESGGSEHLRCQLLKREAGDGHVGQTWLLGGNSSVSDVIAKMKQT